MKLKFLQRVSIEQIKTVVKRIENEKNFEWNDMK
jgi:hypothetical protein